MSDTVISQCSNFLIFKMNHPADVEYIRKMVPNISEEIVEKQKTLQAGTCLAFGQGFKIPLIIKLDMPDPEPRSGNCDVVTIWDGNEGKVTDEEEEEEDYEVPRMLQEENQRPSNLNPEFTSSKNEEPIKFNEETKPNLMQGTEENNNIGQAKEDIVAVPEIPNNLFQNEYKPTINTNVPDNIGLGITSPIVETENKEVPPMSNIELDRKPKKVVETTNGIAASNLEPSSFIDISKSFQNNTTLKADVKEETVTPDIIIPGGQNISGAFMEGFKGINVAQEEQK